MAVRTLLVAALAVAALGTTAAPALARCDEPASVDCTVNCLPSVRVTGNGVEVVRYYC